MANVWVWRVRKRTGETQTRQPTVTHFERQTRRRHIVPRPVFLIPLLTFQ